MRRALWSFVALAIAVPAAAADPQVVLSVNPPGPGAIFRGWPVLVSVLISNPAPDAQLTLAPRSGTWPRAVTLKATGPTGAVEALAFDLTAEPPSASITLPPGASTHFFMLLSESATAALATGRHTITAELEIRDSPAWNGLARASAMLEVKADGQPTDDEQLELIDLRAHIFSIRKQPAEAASALKAHLAKAPDSIPALVELAELLEESGDPGGAFLCTTRALAASGDAPGKLSRGEEPPGHLLTLHRHLLSKLAAMPPASRPAARYAPPPPSPSASKPAPGPPAPSPKVAVPQVSATSPAPSQAPTQAAPKPPAPMTPMEDYLDTLKRGDALFAEGKYFDAVLIYERAWRVAYNNKLVTDKKALDDRLARARKARDEKKKQDLAPGGSRSFAVASSISFWRFATDAGLLYCS